MRFQPKGPNQVRHLPNGSSELVLESKDGRHKVCLIDTADYELVRRYRWCAGLHCTQWYAITNLSRGKQLRMHILLTGKKGMDHKDRDGLNNRRSNFREATWEEQHHNCRKIETRAGKKVTSKYRGVCWHAKSKKFMARITTSGEVKYLGIFAIEEAAAQAYDEAAIRLHGEFANLNGVRP